jgi:hypothetical protein
MCRGWRKTATLFPTGWSVPNHLPVAPFSGRKKQSPKPVDNFVDETRRGRPASMVSLRFMNLPIF